MTTDTATATEVSPKSARTRQKRALRLLAVWVTVAVLLIVAGGLSMLASSAAVAGLPYHSTADKCQLDDPAPDGAAMSGEQTLVTGGASFWPVGYACAYTMEDGSILIQGADDWTATWFAYGGLAAAIGGVALAIGASAAYRRKRSSSDSADQQTR